MVTIHGFNYKGSNLVVQLDDEGEIEEITRVGGQRCIMEQYSLEELDEIETQIHKKLNEETVNG